MGCLSKLVLNSGASWGHTAEITPVKTVGSVLTVWMAQYVSVKQASKETGMSSIEIQVETQNYLTFLSEQFVTYHVTRKHLSLSSDPFVQVSE